MCDIKGAVPYRLVKFTNERFYHVFNRGVEKRKIFSTPEDHERFLQSIYYYQFDGPKPKLSTHKRFRLIEFDKNPKIVDIVCYCLMLNHFHLLIRQVKSGGACEFMRKLLNSYTKYYNTKHDRVGHLFQGTFKAVDIENDDQLLHLSRYIHLNPFASNLTENLDTYKYSSYPSYIGIVEDKIARSELILSFFASRKDYRKFVEDQKGYSRELERIKHLILEEG